MAGYEKGGHGKSVHLNVVSILYVKHLRKSNGLDTSFEEAMSQSLEQLIQCVLN